MLVPEALGRVHCIAVEHLICRPATPTGAKYMLFILAPFLHGFGGSHQSLIYGSLFLIKIQSPAACVKYHIHSLIEVVRAACVRARRQPTRVLHFTL